jgi:hypothetical protein
MNSRFLVLRFVLLDHLIHSSLLQAVWEDVVVVLFCSVALHLWREDLATFESLDFALWLLI